MSPSDGRASCPARGRCRRTGASDVPGALRVAGPAIAARILLLHVVTGRQQPSGGPHTMANRQIVDGAGRSAVSQDTVSQDRVSHRKASAVPGGSGLGAAALLCVATLASPLAAHTVSAE